jgi:hypothetical protein
MKIFLCSRLSADKLINSHMKDSAAWGIMETLLEVFNSVTAACGGVVK